MSKEISVEEMEEEEQTMITNHDDTDAAMDDAGAAAAASTIASNKKTSNHTATASKTSTSRSSKSSLSKCVKCKSRYGNGACSQAACLPCCTDLACEGHKKAREQAAWKQAVLSGTTREQKRAAAKRASAVRKGVFREPAFMYMGQTVTIWNFSDYMENPKWKDDAIRRSEKRRARLEINRNSSVSLRNNRKRFHRIMESLYQESRGNKTDNF